MPQPTALAQGGVRITAVGRTCFEYEVTNPNSEPYDYTVVFNGPDPSRGAAVFGSPGSGGGGNLTRTVTGLAPGATEKGRIDLTAPGPTGPGSRPGAPTLGQPDNPRPPKPELLKVRSVPTAEAPGAGGPCPPSGLRLYADDGDAAMGLRVVGLHLRNCGTAVVTLDGYPQVQPLDLDHKPLDGVRILRGGAGIASGTGADDPPRRSPCARGGRPHHPGVAQHHRGRCRGAAQRPVRAGARHPGRGPRHGRPGARPRHHRAPRRRCLGPGGHERQAVTGPDNVIAL